MAGIRFFIKTKTKNKNALVPIYVRVYSGRKIDLLAKADILVKPDNWSNKAQQARRVAERDDAMEYKFGEQDQAGRRTFKEQIDALRRTIEEELSNARQTDLTTEWLKTVIDKHWFPDKYQVNLFNYIETYIKGAETRINPKTGRPVCYKMQREYQVTFDYLKRYSEHIGKKIDFRDIDLKFYEGFTQFLQKPSKEESLAVNTIGKKIQTLKIFLNSAKDEGLNNYNAYKSDKFIALSEEADTIYLNEKELDELYKLDLSKDPADERVRDLFLVGCWTGCRFSDISQITPESISEGMIHIRQLKTGTKVVIPLHPIVTAILNKYGGVLPKPISNQKFNDALKNIAEKAKLTGITHKVITKGGVRITSSLHTWERVTTHTARRSFATNLYKSGFPSKSIMQITGHKTEEAFRKYIKVTETEHAQMLQKHWNNRYLKVV